MIPTTGVFHRGLPSSRGRLSGELCEGTEGTDFFGTIQPCFVPLFHRTIQSRPYHFLHEEMDR
jgi:hypothetical protein